MPAPAPAGAAPSVQQDDPSGAVKGAQALVRLAQTVQADRSILVDRPAQAAPAPAEPGAAASA